MLTSNVISNDVRGSNSPGSSLGRVIPLCSRARHIASLHPGVQMGSGKFNAGR